MWDEIIRQHLFSPLLVPLCVPPNQQVVLKASRVNWVTFYRVNADRMRLPHGVYRINIPLLGCCLVQLYRLAQYINLDHSAIFIEKLQGNTLEFIWNLPFSENSMRHVRVACARTCHERRPTVREFPLYSYPEFRLVKSSVLRNFGSQISNGTCKVTDRCSLGPDRSTCCWCWWWCPGKRGRQQESSISFFPSDSWKCIFELLIKIAYKDCIFDEIRHCILPLDPGSTGWKLLVLWYD